MFISVWTYVLAINLSSLIKMFAFVSILCCFYYFTTKLQVEICEFPQKIGNSSTRRPSYSTFVHIPKRYPTMHMLNYVHSSLICDSQKLKTTQMSHSRRMGTENVVHFHN